MLSHPRSYATLAVACALCFVVACDSSPPQGVVDSGAMPPPDVTTDGPADAGGEVSDTPDAVAGDVAEQIDAVEGDTPTEPDAALAPCDPALEVASSQAFVLPNGLAVVVVIGGTGAYHFELSLNGSGGLVNDLTGAYVAGDEVGTQDVITITDAGCIGSVQTTISVVPSMTVAPSAPTVPPGTAIGFQVDGGSGDLSYELVVGTSGASVTPSGVYTAGPNDGVDSVRIVDNVTGESVIVPITVITGAAVRPVPSLVFVAPGQTQPLTFADTSGVLELSIQDPVIASLNSEGEVVGVTPGQTTVTAVDSITASVATMEIQVTATPSVEDVRTGDGADWASFAVGDIDGDGIVDAVMGRDEVDLTGWNSGAVYVYKGSTEGLLAEPIQTLAPDTRNMRFGRKVALADYNGDGHLDLFVSAFLADVGFSDNGAVYVYNGIEGAGFEEAPSYTLFGNSSSDYFGYGFTVCDFNADGLLDLAVGASLDENTQYDPTPSNQGAVSIFLARPEGFLPSPDQTLWGDVPNEDGTAIVPFPDLRFGTELASGDHDGDGVCDLAVYGQRYKTPGQSNSRTTDGAVFVYRGIAKTDTFIGGVEAQMIRAMRGSDPVSNSSGFGRKLAFGDVTGDGTDDLLVGQYYHHDPSIGTRPGAARLYLGDALVIDGDIPAWESPDDAAWSVFGDSGYDYCGWDVGIVDADGTMPLDVVVSHVNGEKADGISNAGMLLVHRGVADAVPSTTADIVLSSEIENAPKFGAAFGFLGDIDGDLVGDYIVLAGRENSLGYKVGRPFYVPGAAIVDPTTLVPLEQDGVGSGMQFGRGLAVVGDITGNGQADLVVGAPYGDLEGEDLNSGRLIVYEGSAGGFAVEPTMELQNFSAFSAYDNYGWRVASAGKFDGDTSDDLAVVAYADDLAGNPPGWAQEVGDCGAALSNSGAVAIFSGGSPTLETDDAAFVIYGLEASQYTEAVAGGFDINGDGFDDIAAGSRYLDDGGASNGGGFKVVLGRPKSTAGTTLILCDEVFAFRSYETNAYLGTSMTSIGDVTGDGCDELAVGGYGYDWPAFPGANNQGGVYVLFGWGAQCANAEPKMAVLAPLENIGQQAGFALAGGLPIDGGDSIPDLIVGAHVDNVGGISSGSAWFISGAYIASLESAAEPLTNGQSPSELHPFAPPGSGDVLRVYGTTTSARFGAAVALLPGVGPGGRALVAVGSHLGDLGGVQQSGGVSVFAGGAQGGWDPNPVAIFGGEPSRPGNYSGWSLGAGATTTGAALAVGGIYGTTFGRDQGSVHVLSFTPEL